MIEFVHNDAYKALQAMEDRSVDCIVTSPPYYGLRDYGNPGQIGLEETPEEFISKIVDVFREARRVLKDDGTLWVNIGDSYAAQAKDRTPEQAAKNSTINGGKFTQMQVLKQINKITGDLKPKDLIGIPWMLAFALRADGWYLRQDIIWHKPNPMPESVTDRCTKSHEYIFLLSKNKKYYFDADAIKVDAKNPQDDVRRKMQQKSSNKSMPNEFVNGVRPVKSGNKQRKQGIDRGCPEDNSSNVCSSVPWEGVKANKRSVWSITTKPFKEAHFATFPEDLVVDCIKAGCPEGGVVLDPFAGAGTTLMVAKKLNRNAIGIELNKDYIDIAVRRINNETGSLWD